MADIRINALATTAAASASDDFMAIDGTTNGTRKMSAYTPSFSTVTTSGAGTIGGNLTVTGSAAINGVCTIYVSTGHAYIQGPSAAGKYLTFNSGNTTGGINFRDSAGIEVALYNQAINAWTFSTAITFSGNITASGTGAQSFAGYLAVGGATASATTALITPAGTTGVSSLRIPHGAAPTSPVNGDMWTTTSGLFIRINGATVGPLT